MNHHITLSIIGFYLPFVISIIFIALAIIANELRRYHVVLMTVCIVVTLTIHWFNPALYIHGEGMILSLFPSFLLLQGIGAFLILLNERYHFSYVNYITIMKNALFNPYVVFPVQFIVHAIPDILINIFSIRLPSGIDNAIIGGADFDDALILTPMISLSVAVILSDILGKKVGFITYGVYAVMVLVILL